MRGIVGTVYNIGSVKVISFARHNCKLGRSLQKLSRSDNTNRLVWRKVQAARFQNLREIAGAVRS